MIRLPEVEELEKRFSNDYTPLCVTFRMERNARIVNYTPITLDGLIARAVIEEATHGRGVGDVDDFYWIPLPLKTLWSDRRGLPLWAASVLYPVTRTEADVYIRHKRNTGGEFHNKPKLVTRNGPWMERRIPTPVLVCDRFEARCIGSKDDVASLLERYVGSGIGKLRLGKVVGIDVEETPYSDYDILVRDGELIKNIPADAGLVEIKEQPTPMGWTPPHWKPSLFLDGWMAGHKAARR